MAGTLTSPPEFVIGSCDQCGRSFNNKTYLLTHFTGPRFACYYKEGQPIRPSDLSKFTLHNVYGSSQQGFTSAEDRVASISRTPRRKQSTVFSYSTKTNPSTVSSPYFSDEEDDWDSVSTATRSVKASTFV